MRYRTNDGATFIGETVVTAVKNAEGRVLGWLRLIHDITDRKHPDALVQADLVRLAKKHRYESTVSTVAHSGGVLDLLIFLSTHDRSRRLRVRHGKRMVERCEVCDGL